MLCQMCVVYRIGVLLITGRVMGQMERLVFTSLQS